MNLEILKAHADVAADVATPVECEQAVQALFESHAQSASWSALTGLATFSPEWAFSWILGPGLNSPYRFFELLAQLPQGKANDLLWESAFSLQTLMPYDFRALALENLLQNARYQASNLNPERLRQAQALADVSAELNLREDKDKLGLPTDGIDHLFQMPSTSEEKLRYLRVASLDGIRRQQITLLNRFLAALALPHREDIALTGFRNAEVEELITRDVKCSLIRATDYLVPWDHVIAGPDLTVAEFTRLCLFDDELQSPSPAPRFATIGFHRSVLKTCGRSIVGLKAGTFHVEHGTLAAPSYFYMGRSSALGKGCIIDNVGGAVVLSEAFLGGGFMPILIHTHKHRRAKGESAIQERQKIQPGIFVAKPGVRLPMSMPGILETVDFMAEGSPVEGLTCFPLDPVISVSHRRVVT